jgi:hypothetical protein
MTGIAELDHLLGLKGKISDDTTSILIRGGQGAGKTTLALQILSNRLSMNVKDSQGEVLDNSHNYGLFLSLERPACKTLEYMKREFGLFQAMWDGEPASHGKKVNDQNKIVGMDGEDFTKEVKRLFKNRSPTNKTLTLILDVIDSIAIVCKWLIIGLKRLLSDEKEDAEKEHKEAIKNDLAEAIKKYVDVHISKAAGEQHIKKEPDPTFWLVVDSLNVLERTIFFASEKERYRAAMQGFAKSLNERLGMKVVIIFTGEYHTPDHDVSGASGESFFCDIEILLSQEPVMGISRTDPRNTPAAGYNIELHHNVGWHGVNASNGNRRDQVVVETRPFCRVLKSRFSKNQSRRCSYKIVEQKGFQFDEIFPGDGYMLLFEDNPKQREDWLDFLLKDAPHEFPALRYELFDRTHQQRVFSTERCFSGHRHDTDLHLATFDTYWIKWFIELGQRSIIGEHLEELRTIIREHREDLWPEVKKSKVRTERLEMLARRRYSRAISRIHKIFIDAKSNKTDPNCEDLRSELRAMLGFDISEFLSDIKIGKCWAEFSECTGILQPISQKDLRLFGEQRSPLLRKLVADHKYIKDDNSGTLISIPFNANISFLVYRKDLLDAVAEKIGESPKLKEEFRDKLIQILSNERQKTNEFIGFWPKMKQDLGIKDATYEDKYAIPLSIDEEQAECFKVAENIQKKDYVPQTWEEVIALCDVFGWEYLIETRSFDTLLCTFLEFVWGCDTDLKVDAEYNLTIDKGILMRIYQAIFLFQELLKHIPDDATLDARILGRYMGKGGDNYEKRKRKVVPEKEKDVQKTNWGFMRQWHSTLVDILVAKDNNGKHLWIPNSKTKLEISPLPESFWHFYRKNDKPRLKGISCWGDWHLAMLRGSENQSLAVGLINNIMSSSKISTRALRGAALPSVQKFYEIYRESPCVHLPERSGDLTMPTKSYEYVESKLFPIAQTRSNIFDYRHCMLEIHGFVIELVHNRCPRTPEDVSKALISVFKEIKKLSGRELLLH